MDVEDSGNEREIDLVEEVARLHQLEGVTRNIQARRLTARLVERARELCLAGEQSRSLQSANDAERSLAVWFADAGDADDVMAVTDVLTVLATAHSANLNFGTAESAADKAVTALRTIADPAPKCRPKLLAALGALAQAQLQNQSHAKALATINEAIDTARKLYEENPDVYRRNLAGSLHNAAKCNLDAGREAVALEQARESLSLFTEVYRLDRSAVMHYCQGLNLVAAALDSSGRVDEALRYRNEAVEIARGLAVGGSLQTREMFAANLANLAIELHSAERHTESIAAGSEALSLFEDIAREQPGYQPYIAKCQGTLAKILKGARQFDEATTMGAGSVALLRSLAELNAAAYAPELAAELNNLAGIFDAAGQRDDARRCREESAKILSELADSEWGYWPAEVSNVASSMTEVQDLKPGGFFQVFHAKFLARLELVARDEMDDEFDRFDRFSARYCRAVRHAIHAGSIDDTTSSAALLTIASALHSRDLQALLMAEEDLRTNGDPDKLDLADAQRAMILKLWEREDLVEKQKAQHLTGSDPETAAELQRLRKEWSKENQLLGVMRARYSQALERVKARDPAFSGATQRTVHLTQIATALRSLSSGQGLNRGTRLSVLCLMMELPGESGEPEALGLIIRCEGKLTILSFPDLSRVSREFASYEVVGRDSGSRRMLLGIPSKSGADPGKASRASKEAPSAPNAIDTLLPRLHKAFFDPIDLSADLPESCEVIVCAYGGLHALPFSSLNSCKGSPAEKSVVMYPGLPTFLAAVTGESARQDPGGRWILASDAALDTSEPIPMAILETAINAAILHDARLDVTCVGSGDECEGAIGGLLAMCHGDVGASRSVSLQLGKSNLTAHAILNRPVSARTSILSSCLSGPSPDERGNAAGLPVALMLRGCRVLSGYSKPVLDAYAPWLSSLIIWHICHGMDPWEASHLSRRAIARCEWPAGYLAFVRSVMSRLVPLRTGDASPPIASWMKGVAHNWPWKGQEALVKYIEYPDLTSDDEREQFLDGLLVPLSPEDFRVGALELSTFMQVFGRPA